MRDPTSEAEPDIENPIDLDEDDDLDVTDLTRSDTDGE